MKGEVDILTIQALDRWVTRVSRNTAPQGDHRVRIERMSFSVALDGKRIVLVGLHLFYLSFHPIFLSWPFFLAPS